MKYIRLIFVAIYIFIIGLIFTFASENAEESTQTSNNVTELIVDIYDEITPTEESVRERYSMEEIKTFIRKGIGHFGMFFALGLFGLLSAIFFFDKKYKILLIPLILGLGVASISEILQIFAAGRAANIMDVLLDYGGYAVASLLVFVIYIIIIKIKGKKEMEDGN